MCFAQHLATKRIIIFELMHVVLDVIHTSCYVFCCLQGTENQDKNAMLVSIRTQIFE